MMRRDRRELDPAPADANDTIVARTRKLHNMSMLEMMERISERYLRESRPPYVDDNEGAPSEASSDRSTIDIQPRVVAPLPTPPKVAVPVVVSNNN